MGTLLSHFLFLIPYFLFPIDKQFLPKIPFSFGIQDAFFPTHNNAPKSEMRKSENLRYFIAHFLFPNSNSLFLIS